MDQTLAGSESRPRGEALEQRVETDSAALYLPDFCSARVVFLLVLIAELVAMMLAVAAGAAGGTFWLELAKSSFFLLWIALVSAALLCAARRHLRRWSVPAVSAWSLGLLLFATATVSETVWWLGEYWRDRLSVEALALFPRTHASFLLGNLAIMLIVGTLLLRYFYVSYEWRRNVEMEARSRIDALQARIRPHFLFNSMNTIAALTRTDPARAEEAVEDLADLFRATLADAQPHISLKQELELARIYQRIEELRLGDRLRVDWQVEGLPLRCTVPGLTLQPLLENAIYHGIEPLPEGGTVTISGRLHAGDIELTVANPLPPEPRPGRAGHRLALDNIRERLALAYQGRASLTVHAEPHRYEIVVRFPCKEAPPA